MEKYLNAIEACWSTLKNTDNHFTAHFDHAKRLYDADTFVLLTQSPLSFEFLIQETPTSEKFFFKVAFEETIQYSLDEADEIDAEEGGETILRIIDIDSRNDHISFYMVGLLFLQEKFPAGKELRNDEHMRYTRQGMIERVLAERRYRSEKENYHIEWADNIYGNHAVFNDRGQKYLVFLRDFVSETGYSDSPDSRQNKLGTTKHIMYAFEQLKSDPKLRRKLKQECPFVEIYLDPLNDHLISWFYPHELPEEVATLIQEYFGEKNYLTAAQEKTFLGFLDRMTDLEEQVMVRPEVHQKIDGWYETEMMQWVKENHEIPFEEIRANLYPYQKKGVEFVTFSSGNIIADEMGLGKTLQSIAAAVAKKKIFSFRKTLIVCPASLKSQWKKEIEKFSGETATIIEGSYETREQQYKDVSTYFLITNYEAIRKDFHIINRVGIDFLILDEAQRVKNFQTITWNAISRLERKHILIITGTPIENKLVDIYSLMQLVNPQLLGPLWEFSYQHCLFDPYKTNKITGYYDLHLVKEKLKSVLLRREKHQVIKELPQVNTMDVYLKLSREQRDLHSGYYTALSKILRKKFLTPVDHTRIMMYLTQMRMVSNSTYLVDEETNHSTKLLELEHTLLEKLDILNNDNKIIIFSEWVKSHKLIGDLLRKHGIGFAELNGKVPVPKRGDLIAAFENNPECKVFLSTEAGGAGLNLQVADTLINFELPWNPAKKNQRIGRIDRLGQKSSHLRVLNFVCVDSFEIKIATGLTLKQDLFDGVLNASKTTEFVDFSSKGRSQFLDELEQMLSDLEVTTEAAVVDDPQEENAELNEPLPLNETTEEFESEASVTNGGDPAVSGTPSSSERVEKEPLAQENTAEKMEQVMNQGMGFLAGLFEMATGQSMDMENKQIEVDKETGEVTMKFKLPGFGK